MTFNLEKGRKLLLFSHLQKNLASCIRVHLKFPGVFKKGYERVGGPGGYFSYKKGEGRAVGKRQGTTEWKENCADTD